MTRTIDVCNPPHSSRPALWYVSETARKYGSPTGCEAQKRMLAADRASGVPNQRLNLLRLPDGFLLRKEFVRNPKN
jgi:hypothetical protein